jgi:hypothetical protein
VKQRNLPVSTKELQGKDTEKISTHELIIKFSGIRQELISKILKEQAFSNLRVVRKDKAEIFVYCQFTGDINELNKQLKALKSKALLSLGKQGGDKSSILLEFFVDFNELLPVSPVLTGPEQRSRKPASWVAALLAVVLLILGANRYWPIIEDKLSPQVSTTKITAPAPTHPAWNMFVLPRYQPEWIEVKRTFGLDEKTMLELFRRIKSTGHEGYGGILNDLTEYPGIINRALSLIILDNVRDANQLQILIKDLEKKFLRSRPFPDQSGKDHDYINALDHKQLENAIVLTFYEHISREPSFTSSFIGKIRKGSNISSR